MKKLAIYSISVVFIFSVCVRAEEILPGEYKTGYIGLDQNDTYTFDANAGDVVTILMGAVNDYLGFEPQVELHEPDGSWTSQWGSSSATLNAITIKQSGTCTIIARERDGDANGTYGLSMIKNPGTELNDPEDDPVPILPGEYKSGYIAEGDLDGYTFYADAGDVVTILMGEFIHDYGVFEPQVELIEPDGSRTSQWGNESATLNALKIEQSGTCVIIARAYDGSDTGTYGLSMIKNPGTELNDPEDDPVPILPGEYKSGYIAEGDLDGYTFYANAGDVVTILMGEAGGGFSPQVELLEPDGSRTSQWGYSSATLQALTIEQSGTCVIIARDNDGDSTGTYGLSMIKNPCTELNDPEDDPVPILPGEYKSGYIAEGDLDGYSFYANAGDVVTILMEEINDYGGFHPQVELIEPDGNWTSQWGYASAILQELTIEQSGNCVIIARDRDGDANGTYELSMSRFNMAGTPTISSLSDFPDPVIQQGTLTLTALGVNDPNGWIVQVDFYRDLNRNGYLDLCGGDQLLGSDTNDVNGWSWSGSIGCLPPVGQNNYFTRAKDNDGFWSDTAGSTGEILPLYDGDFDINCKVDFLDFAVLGAHWLDDTCSEPDWCDGTDIDKSGDVEWIDLGRFTEDWLEGIGP